VEGEAWHVGIEDPSDPERELAVVGLRSGALATSSIAVRAWNTADGRRAHHLIDPRTREPAEGGLRAVTVEHADPAWAEIWSKALFVSGASTIGHEARARGMAAWWVEDDGSFHLTPAARERTLWQRDF
jgi:thiamine biosynthesis lipoprotein